MKSVCVYCGANSGADPAFALAAGEVGRLLAASGRTVVYGGGRVGLMGTLADAALAAGGRVVGVIPQALVDKEVTQLVTDMATHRPEYVPKWVDRYRS